MIYCQEIHTRHQTNIDTASATTTPLCTVTTVTTTTYTVSDLIRGELKGLSTSNIRLANFGW